MDVSTPKPQAARTGQTVQRVKVGVTGLAVVLLLILLASALMRSVGHQRTGAPRAELAANMASANAADANEPLAEIGAAPAAQANESLPAPGASHAP